MADTARLVDDSGVIEANPEAGVAEVTLDRPDARNGLSLDLIEALHAAFTRLGARGDINAIVLSARGPAFCAGHDL